MTAREFPWPLVEGGLVPEWVGKGFRVGDRVVPVLRYSGAESGWSDDLTRMHEESAGSDHPIDCLSRGWALAALRRHVRNATPVLLEIGCSSGFLLSDLSSQFATATVVGSDFLSEPLERLAAHLPGIPLLQFDAVRCPLPTASVDAVILLNVLEHIKDDLEALKQVARILNPGGIAVIEVPAGPHLYDVYDEQLRHYRRYSARALTSLIAAAGLTVAERSHLGFLTYPGFALTKRSNQRLATAGTDVKRRVVEANIANTRRSVLLHRLLSLEAWLGRYVSYPFGIRCVAVGRKPPEAYPPCKKTTRSFTPLRTS